MALYRKSATVIAVLIESNLDEALDNLNDISDVEVDLDVTGDLTYNKWGGEQTAKVGDYLINNNGEAYTCDGQVFADTYEEVGDDEYVKTATIEATEATEAGSISTLEGESAYEAGDFLVTNPGGDRYCITRDKFLAMYEEVEAATA